MPVDSWTSIRGLHDCVLIDTLIAKGVDVSAIYDGKTISFARKVMLNPDNRLVSFHKEVIDVSKDINNEIGL